MNLNHSSLLHYEVKLSLKENKQKSSLSCFFVISIGQDLCWECHLSLSKQSVSLNHYHIISGTFSRFLLHWRSDHILVVKIQSGGVKKKKKKSRQTRRDKKKENLRVLFFIYLSLIIYFVGELLRSMDSPRSIEELIQELDQPNLTGWKLFAQTSDVKVYRKIDDDVNSFFSFNRISSSSSSRN